MAPGYEETRSPIRERVEFCDYLCDFNEVPRGRDNDDLFCVLQILTLLVFDYFWPFKAWKLAFRSRLRERTRPASTWSRVSVRIAAKAVMCLLEFAVDRDIPILDDIEQESATQYISLSHDVCLEE